MILQISNRTTFVESWSHAPTSEEWRKALLEWAQGKSLEMLNERVVSFDGHDYDLIVKRKKDIYSLLLRRR